MNTIKFIIVISIGLLSTDLIYHQVVNGQQHSKGKRVGSEKILYNYILNIALDICLKTFVEVKNDIDNIDGRISIDNIEPNSCNVDLFITKPDDVLPIIKINVWIADTELENNEVDISIIGTLAQQEYDVPFADIAAKTILDDYENLKPWVKEGIVHRIGKPDEPKRVVSRFLEVKYRMHDKFYPEIDEMGNHDNMKMKSLNRFYPT